MPPSPEHSTHSQKALLTALKAAGDDTRLRLLMLLTEAEHNVKDLTEILGQSQPRLSRHLKLLTSAGLIERFQEGAWVYYRASRNTPGAALTKAILSTLTNNDPTLQKDRTRASAVLKERALEAQNYFKTHAENWDEIRRLYVKEEMVETTILEMLGKTPIERLIDLGTGTGRILELLCQQFKAGIGIDINHEMLRHARARLNRLNLTTCELRRGDITALDLESGIADTIIMHQVLHFFADPLPPLAEAARLLNEKGRLLIVDFAPHRQEQLRSDFAHQRLGFKEQQLWASLKEVGLKALNFKTLTTTENTLGVSLWLASKETA